MEEDGGEDEGEGSGWSIRPQGEVYGGEERRKEMENAGRGRRGYSPESEVGNAETTGNKGAVCKEDGGVEGRGGGDGGGGGEWEQLSNIMRKAAEEVCGVEGRRVQNPWTVGYEEEIRERNTRIERAVDKKNRAMEVVTARQRLRRRSGGGGNQEERWEEEVRAARSEVATERGES